MKNPVVLTALAVATLAVSAAFADSPPPPRHHPICLDTSRIESMSYPDNKTIIFHMRGGPVRTWRNDLGRECPGLAFERGIAWTIWGNEVCENMQIFYVLRRGTPCGLGKFTPVETPPRGH